VEKSKIKKYAVMFTVFLLPGGGIALLAYGAYKAYKSKKVEKSKKDQSIL